MNLTGSGAWAFLYLVIEWGIRVTMLVVVPFRRSPEAAKGWLLLVMFLPLPAVLLYAIIGRARFPRWRQERFARLPELLNVAREEIRHSQICEKPDLPSNLEQAANLIQNLGHFPTMMGNNADLLSDYDGVIDRLVADIDRAQHHVHMRGGSVCLNRPRGIVKWISAVVMPQPGLAAAR
jgi:cardiolipin synthase